MAEERSPEDVKTQMQRWMGRVRQEFEEEEGSIDAHPNRPDLWTFFLAAALILAFAGLAFAIFDGSPGFGIGTGLELMAISLTIIAFSLKRQKV